MIAGIGAGEGTAPWGTLIAREGGFDEFAPQLHERTHPERSEAIPHRIVRGDEVDVRGMACDLSRRKRCVPTRLPITKTLTLAERHRPEDRAIGHRSPADQKVER